MTAAAARSITPGSPSMTHSTQRRLARGRYRLIEVAGRGGMAVVWRGEQAGDLNFRRPVAIKQMHDHLADKPLYVEMFAEEARVGAELVSPNIAQVYDFVHEKGDYFLVMEWVEGIDLGSFIRHHVQTGRRTRWDLITAIGIGLLRALSAAHERRTGFGEVAPIVHRDVSPHNILITTTGMVKLIDFGLSLAGDRGKELTEPGVVKGKMSYLSPEVVGGQRPTMSTDIYAAGSVMWESLVGRRLFEGVNDFEVYRKVRDNQVQPLRPLRKDIPRSLVAVINRALTGRPEQRFTSARQMGKELTQVLRSSEAHRDLHGLLSNSVADVRSALSIGRQTREPAATTPVADYTESDAEIAFGQELVEEPKRGLLHRLPFFRRRG
jgi:serine/threonine-protein kinase